MKKITKILSLVLAVAMLALALSSCGITSEARVAAAMLKMTLVKKMDCTANVNITLTMAGNTVEMPMTVVMKTDTTDENNPLSYTEISMTVGGKTQKTTSYYRDGYLYTDEFGGKIRLKKDYEGSTESANLVDIAGIFGSKQSDVDESFTITENKDGTLSVKMTVSKDEFEKENPGFSESLAASLAGKGTVDFSDVIFEYIVDKNNNISKIKAEMNMEMTVQGQTVDILYDMEFNYTAIDKNFEVPAPEDVTEYVPSGRD